MPATTAGKMLPSAWARPLKKKAQKVTSAAARERSRLIIREASGKRLVYPGKGAPAMGAGEKRLRTFPGGSATRAAFLARAPARLPRASCRDPGRCGTAVRRRGGEDPARGRTRPAVDR